MRRSQKSKKMSDSPKLFQLNQHCFYEIFEYFCLKDLHSFGQTCKRMNKVAGEYFKQNHSSAKKFLRKDGIYTYVLNKHGENCGIQTPGFNKFIPYISIISDIHLKYIKSPINEFESINHICLNLCLNHKRVNNFEKLLPQLEIVHIAEHCTIVDGDFYDLILKHCKNLKAIYVEYSDVSSRINSKFNWLLQEYPKLEHLYLTPRHSGPIEELREFFAHNPNVH